MNQFLSDNVKFCIEGTAAGPKGTCPFNSGINLIFLSLTNNAGILYL